MTLPTGEARAQRVRILRQAAESARRENLDIADDWEELADAYDALSEAERDAAQWKPRPCCGNFKNCTQPCVPRLKEALSEAEQAKMLLETREFQCQHHGPWRPVREAGCPACVIEMRTELGASERRIAALETALRDALEQRNQEVKIRQAAEATRREKDDWIAKLEVELQERNRQIAAQDKLLADWEERAAVGEFEDVRAERDRLKGQVAALEDTVRRLSEPIGSAGAITPFNELNAAENRKP